MTRTNTTTESKASGFAWPPITLRLPGWVGEETGPSGGCFPTVEDRMDLAIRLAERSIEEDAGAPFGACVFEIESGLLVAPSVSLVLRRYGEMGGFIYNAGSGGEPCPTRNFES